VVGAISGFFFGLFLGLTLFMFKLYQSDSPVLLILPAVGIFAGIALGLWAPLRRGAQPQASEPPAPT
jgi:hypothetical protein